MRTAAGDDGSLTCDNGAADGEAGGLIEGVAVVEEAGFVNGTGSGTGSTSATGDAGCSTTGCDDCVLTAAALATPAASPASTTPVSTSSIFELTLTSNSLVGSGPHASP